MSFTAATAAQSEIQTADISIDLLRPYEKNARKHPEHQIKALASAIKRFGFTQPVILDEEFTILAGHGRFEAARRLNLDTIPCRILKGLTQKEKSAYIISDNKVAEESSWDTNMLLNELDSISDLDLGKDLNALLNQNTFVQTKVEQVPINNLKEHPENYKTHPEEQLKHLRKSISEYGIYRNIIIATDGTILAGHGVYQAAKELKLTSIPCLRVSLDPFSIKALKLIAADNEIAHIADTNARDLTGILQKVLIEDDLLGTGYDKEKLEALLLVSRSLNEVLNTDEEWIENLDFSPMNSALKCVVTFENENDRASFFNKLGVSFTEKTKKLWWPLKEREKHVDKIYVESDF